MPQVQEPEGHLVQEILAAVDEKNPSVQTTQLMRSEVALPAGQTWHAVLPGRLVYPSAQFEYVEAATLAEKVPAGQRIH